MEMTRCLAITNVGKHCGILAEKFRKGYCHVHDPNGKFRQQNPKKSKKEKKQGTKDLEAALRESIVQKLSKVNPYYLDGSCKNSTLILAEAIAIVQGRQ
jgi:hypothetical protein